LRDRLRRVAWRQALACGKKSALRSVRVGRWTHGVKPQRVTGSGCAQLPLCPQWPRMKSDRGRQYRDASRTGHGEIRSQTRAVSGSVALVTTPLRSPVTRAASRRTEHPWRALASENQRECLPGNHSVKLSAFHLNHAAPAQGDSSGITGQNSNSVVALRIGIAGHDAQAVRANGVFLGEIGLGACRCTPTTRQ
jgi:hypothetical protein